MENIVKCVLTLANHHTHGQIYTATQREECVEQLVVVGVVLLVLIDVVVFVVVGLPVVVVALAATVVRVVGDGVGVVLVMVVRSWRSS